MKKPNGKSSPSGARAEPGDILLDRPRLFEYLSEAAWEDGTERELSTLTLFTADGRWRASLNDKALNRIAFMSGATPEACLDNLENGLENDDLDWRPNRGASGPGSKKKA